MEINKLNVTISKTANGQLDYLQIMSEDVVTLNLVFVVGEINLVDHRKAKEIKENEKP